MTPSMVLSVISRSRSRVYEFVSAQHVGIIESGDQKKIDCLTQAFLPMKKLDIAALESACGK